MKEMKRILSLFLCLAMLVGCLPMGALATENEGVQLETTAPVETVLLTADGENEDTAKDTEPVVTDPAVTEPAAPKTVVPGTTVPETTVPETTVPETTVPETTVPETTVPETTVPETTVPETTVPETTVPETTVPETTVPETTVPEETEPEETEPEETEPEEDAWTRYQEALKRYEELIAELEASHKLAMEKEAAEKVVKKPDGLQKTTGSASTTAAAAVALADNPIYVLAGGDFQQAGDHVNSAENVRNILAQISQKYDTMDGFLFVGDYDCETHGDANETTAGIATLMDTVDNTYDNLNHSNSILVQGNHDSMDANIDATGGHDFDGYSVFVMNEDDYPDGGGTEAGVKALAEKLKTWLNTKLGEGYDAPIFITSHLPLAFSPRTNVVGDGKYAKLIFDVLNHAAGEGLNIIFMHGHNHAYGNDNYLGGEAIYLPKGEKINIAELGSTTAWTEETLNFTYMNPGYVGYYNDWNYVTTEGTDKLTMTVFAITNSEVTVERYSANGLYNLKSGGRNGRYVRSSEASADSLGLAYNTTVYTSPQTISLGAVEDYGNIGEWIGVADEVTDDVTPENEGWVEIIAPDAGETTYAYTQADSIVQNGEYVIVGNNHNVALRDNNGSMDSKNVTISGTTMTSDELLTEWTFSGTNSGTIYNGTRYLRYNNSFSLNANSSTTFTFNDKGNNFQIVREGTRMGTDYYFYYNGSSWTRSSSNQYVRLFVRNKDGDITTGDVKGTWGKISGDLSYNATAGMTADQAMALVQAGIDGYYYDAMSIPGSAVTGTKIHDSTLTWEWVDEFDGNTAGDYAVKISYVYNGTKYELATAEVVVPAATTYYIAEGNGLYIVDMNTTEADALATVKAGVTVSSANDTLNSENSNKQPVDDADVTWNWVDKYNGADSGPYTVEILYGETSLGTVEVKVDVQYKTEIKTDWTEIGETEGSGGTTTVTYTLDTDGIDAGSNNKYIIVARNQAYLLDAGSARAVTISADGKTATTSTRDYEYYFTGSTSGLITRDGTNTLYQQNWGIHTGYNETANLDAFVNNGSGYYRLYDNDSTARSLYYGTNSTVTSNAWTVTESNHDNSNYTIRLYKYTSSETTGGTPGGKIYAKIEGPTVYTVTQGTTAAEALGAVKAGITGYTATDTSGADKTELADSDLTWKWKNTYASMVVGSYWLEISYQDKVLGTVEVRVEPGVVNNYPEYPDEGSVKVSKTGTGIDFQSSGIAQVEVSASGVPMKKGADVIVMLDTSSSMTSHTVTGTSETRAQVLEESLKNLIDQFKTPGADGALLDIRVAIADFNGFYGENHNASGTPYDRDAADMMSDDISYDANSEAKVYTGDGTLGAGAFIPVEDLAASYTLNYTSGTNYDYAMDGIYQMGTAIKRANTEDRDLYVIFMSDGAAMQWNYYHSQGRSSLWNNWITGAWTANQLSLNCNTHAYYYDEVDHNGDGMRNEHRMANAIKGDPNETYEVIRKTNTLGTPTGETNMYLVPGLGATMFSISFDAQADTNVTEESMDKSIASLASEQTGTTQYYYKVTAADELTDAFDAIGSEIAYAAYNARFVDQMGDDYNLQMKTSTYSVVDGTSTTNKTLAPKIEIIQYDIYTRQDYLNNDCSKSQIGDRKGTYKVLETVTFNADGTEAYSDQINNSQTNILADGTQTGYVKGVIYAKTFLYNTNASGVAVDGVQIPTGVNADDTTTGSTNVLPAETFYWKLGTVQTSELAMRYYVYLTGSMEGTREGGSYPTNEYATLYYDNYLGNPCYKDTVSPVMPWKEANVSYAFYLVDENGDIVVNQTTGQTGSFANKIAVTNPVVYKTVLLNNEGNVQAIKVADVENTILPLGYELYDSGAEYEVKINSNTTGSWKITNGGKPVDTTYVTQYNPGDASAYSNALTDGFDENGTAIVTGHDYTHTVVWFAVLWKIQALPDSVVVDYGLPVDISVLTNDMFGENGKLAGVGAYSENLNLDGHTETMASGFGANHTGTYGTAKADTTTGKVRYTLNTMQMAGYDKFAYAANYIGATNPGYYYDAVTVIPATTIYYEDGFLSFNKYNTNNERIDTWDTEGKQDTNATQDEDRPGQYSLTDANNIYGYDSVNNGMSTFSLGQARKVHVDANSYATAEFTFTGTGFDVISMTSNTTGTIAVKVTDANGTKEAAKVVSTYYGYTTEQHYIQYTYTDDAWTEADLGKTLPDGKNVSQKPADPQEGDTYIAEKQVWVATPDTANALYQVPVLQIENLTYGTHKVLITASHADVWDETTADGYDLYLDAIRIYNPAGTTYGENGNIDNVIQDAYIADGEGWPSYIELRNKLISANSFDKVANDKLTEDMEGLVFIDGDATVGNAQLADYVSYGPNNEVYLAKNQSVAFLLGNVTDNVQNIHLGAKSADGRDVTYTIKNIAQKQYSENGVDVGDAYNEKTNTLNTATDMYYDITGWKNDIIVITNTSDSILSLTNIKATYKSDLNAAVVTSENGDEDTLVSDTVTSSSQEVYAYMTPAAATLTLRSMNNVVKEPEETQPDESVPETTVPDPSEPEPSDPETSEPEESIPETTVPEKPADKQEQFQQAMKEAVTNMVNTVKKALKSLFGKWFR